MEKFGNYAYYYDAFYRNKDYIEESKTVDYLLKKYGDGIKKVINYGCGTGKHDIELTKMGYECTGIDMSPLMIKIAKDRCTEELKDRFFVADIREYEPTEEYEAVISLFHVMSYQNTNEDIKRAFRCARKALKANGIFLFDSWYGPGVLSDKPCVRVREIEDDENRLIRIARPVLHDKKNVVDVCYEVLVMNKKSGIVKMINETHSMRYFFMPEIEYLLAECGFELIDILDAKTLDTTSCDSWTSYFIAKAV